MRIGKTYLKKNFMLSKRTEIVLCPLGKANVKGFETNTLNNFDAAVTRKFDLYLIDGPYDSPHYSKYDIMNIAQSFEPDDQFIIVMDDYNRIGEKETIADLIALFKNNNLKEFHNSYTGNKSIM